MKDEIPYYQYDESAEEPYIDDDDLKDFLLDLLGDKVSEEEIDNIIKASDDESISEEEFDNMLSQFILKNKSL